ncbi:MAG: nitrilase-related carbon-nitrogen hydrolase, partial [Woeseia sp.]
MSTLNVAIIQAELDWHDAQSNRERFSARIDALDTACDLIVLPEMFTTGFSMDAPGQAEAMDGPSLQWLADQAKKA